MGGRGSGRAGRFRRRPGLHGVLAGVVALVMVVVPAVAQQRSGGARDEVSGEADAGDEHAGFHVALEAGEQPAVGRGQGEGDGQPGDGEGLADSRWAVAGMMARLSTSSVATTCGRRAGSALVITIMPGGKRDLRESCIAGLPPRVGGVTPVKQALKYPLRYCGDIIPAD